MVLCMVCFLEGGSYFYLHSSSFSVKRFAILLTLMVKTITIIFGMYGKQKSDKIPNEYEHYIRAVKVLYST